MQVIHEEPDLTTPFEIKTDPRRIRSKLVDAVMDRLWWVVIGYVGTLLVKAVVMLT